MAQSQWAGSFQGGGSDKVWAIAQIGSTVYTKWGKRGLSLQSGEKPCADEQAATKLYNSKVTEKQREGYQPVQFGDPNYGIEAWFAAYAQSDAIVPAPLPLVREVNNRFLATRLKATIRDDIIEKVQGGWGLTEKVNGNRCLLHFDGETVTAYNRIGQKQNGIPQGASELVRLGTTFTIDGEWLPTGFIMFDLLELGGKNFRQEVFKSRIQALEEALRAAGLITTASPVHDPNGAALQLLVPGGLEWHKIIQEKAGVEGVVVRNPEAVYVGNPNPTDTILKFKFLDEIDCFVIQTKPGRATGSVMLGIVRESDGAILHVGSVRSGLLDADIANLTEAIQRGERPVLRVQYLGARTVGIALVEPKTNMEMRRNDKTWAECTTAQYAANKREIIASAPVWR